MSDIYLLRVALKDMFSLRRMLVAMLLAVFPAALAMVVRFAARRVPFEAQPAYETMMELFVFGFLLVILSVVFGTGVVNQEISDKTIVYLLTRPIPRWRILLMKYIAAVIAVTLSVWISASLLALATYGLQKTEVSATLRPRDFKDFNRFAQKINAPEDPVAVYIRQNLDESLQQKLIEHDVNKPWPREIRQELIASLNQLLRTDANFYTPERFEQVKLSDVTRQRFAMNPTGSALALANRAALEDAFPKEIVRKVATQMRLARDLMILPVGALAYTALFLLLATMFRWALFLGLMFSFGYESWVSTLIPGYFKLLSLMSYLKVLAPRDRLEDRPPSPAQMAGLFSEVTIQPWAAWTVLFGVVAVALLFAMFIFSVREYVPRDDAG